MSLKKKIIYSFDLGLFLSGIFLILVSKGNTNDIGIRVFLGQIAIISSYFLFPFIDTDKKEKFYNTVLFHFIILIISLFIAYASLNMYMKNENGAIWWQEIGAAFGILFVLTYLSYLLINFVRSLYLLSVKLISFLINSNVQSKYQNAKKIIEKITALVVTLTALAASITALIASLKNLV